MTRPAAAAALGVLALVVATAVQPAAAYTVVIGPHVTSCFHQEALNVNDHIAFSFAVRASR